jgi:hypothetical protein
LQRDFEALRQAQSNPARCCRAISPGSAAARPIAQTASEQHGAIREISRTVNDASDGVREVAHHISGVAVDADAARDSAREALVTARSMAESDALHRVIGEVLTQVRAA